MKQNYLLPAIQRKLESDGKYISRGILGNPRVTEINDITTQYVKRMGNLFMYDPFSSIYEDKFNHMMDYFLQDSSYDEFGIELQREATEEKQNRQRRVKYVRVAGKPHIVQIIDLDTGEERFIDIRSSEQFENLDLSDATQVKKKK